MLQNKKRSNRPSGGPINNSSSNMRSPRSRPIMAEGVYSNGYFLHAAASHLGDIVKVQTKGGVIVEGIFKTFSPSFQIALEVTHSYQNGADGKKINVDTVQEFLIINPCDIVTIHAKDVDLEYVTKDTLLFQTDTDISSRLNGGNSRFEDKELEPWDGSDNLNGEMSVSLELDNNVNGWDVNEMFQKNEKDYGVRTTFNETLLNYTVQIEKKDTQDFREKELQAERIANEIEKNPVYRERVELENGDEETAFAAVIRPGSNPNAIPIPNPNPNNNNRESSSSGRDSNSSNTQIQITATTTNNNSSGGTTVNAHNSIPPNVNINNNNNNNGSNPSYNNNIDKMNPTGKYIAPHKRNKNMPNTKMVRNTPPPSSMSGVPQSPQAPIVKSNYPLIQQQTQMAPPPQQQNQQQQQQQQQQSQQPQSQYGGHISHGQSHGHVYTPPSQMHNPHQTHSGPPSSGNKMNNQDGGSYNNNNKQQMASRGSRTYQPSNSHPPPPPVSFNEPPPQLPTVQGIPGHQMGKSGMGHPHATIVATHIPPPNVSVPDTQQPPPSAHVVGGHQHHVVLQPVATAVAVPPQSSVSSTANILPPQPQRPPRIREDQMPRSRDDELQSFRKFKTDFTLAPPSGQQSGPPQPQSQQDSNNQREREQRDREEKSHVQNQATPPLSSTSSSVNSNHSNNNNNTGNSNNNTSSGNNSNNNIETTPTSSNVVTGGSGANGSGQENKATAGPKKYVLNPAAKPFTPRSPSTPTQSRPHTPITPSPLAQQQQQQTQQPQMAQQAQAYTTVTTGGQMPQMMMTYVMPNANAFQAPQQPHTMPRNPTRKMLHVAAATGQPLLTPAPLQQVIHYPQTPQAHPFQTQTYQPAQVVRMYHEPPHQPSTVQYLAPTPPSTTPSPGQNHQYHPGPQPSPAGGGPTYPQAPQFQMFQPVQIIQPTHNPSFPLVYQGGQQGHPQVILMHNQHQNSAQ